jgi:DNA recombination protein RmuC
LQGNSEILQKTLGDLNSQLNTRLKDSSQLLTQSQKDINERLDNASQVVGDLRGKLGKLEEANARLFEVGKDIRSLQEILKTPKLRGSLGEFLLSDLLAQILPGEHFDLQYAFKNNEKVDAVVKIGGQLVAVDAKFPLENFQRFVAASDEAEKKSFRKMFVSDVKKHIEAIASKYIRPDEGTYDFALMYVPAENIYYEVIVKDEAAEGEHLLAHHAMKKRVIPVSPNTLYVYLNTIVLGLKGLRIEKAAQEILNGLARLGNDLGRIQEAFRKVGLHMQNARGAYEDAENRLGKFGEKMERLHGQPGELSGEALLAVEEAKMRALPANTN